MIELSNKAIYGHIGIFFEFSVMLAHFGLK